MLMYSLQHTSCHYIRYYSYNYFISILSKDLRKMFHTSRKHGKKSRWLQLVDPLDIYRIDAVNFVFGKLCGEQIHVDARLRFNEHLNA